MAFETMRRFLTPQEEENTAGGSNTLLEDFEAAMNKTPKAAPLTPDEQMRWEAAGPGATAPIDPRATVDYLDSLQGKLAPADNLLPAPLPREKMTPVTTLGSFPRLGEKLSGSLTDRLAAPIPVANASVKSDAATPVASALPPTGPKTPAGPPDSSGKDGMVSPPSEGAGGDADEERNLYLARLIARNAASFGAMGAGKSIDTGAVEALGERLKQVQALRAKREEQGLVDAQAQANNRAQVEYLMQRFPERREALAGLRDMTKSPNFSQMLRVEEQIALDKARRATEEVKPGVALRGAEVKEGTLEERITHNRAMEAMARAAAALAAERAAKPAAEERGVKPEALTNRLKDLNAQTKPFQEIVSSLKEADAALSALGTGQISRGAKIASKIPLVGESLVSTPELRAMQGQEGLKQSYQKLKTGLAAVGQELASFERQFGTDWQADPRKAPLAIETLKQITQDALRRTQAPFGAGTGNAALDQMEVLSLLKNTGGLTADNPIFQPNPKLAAAAGMTPPSAAPAEGKVRMISPDGRPAKIPVADVEARKAQGWKEAP